MAPIDEIKTENTIETDEEGSAQDNTTKEVKELVDQKEKEIMKEANEVKKELLRLSIDLNPKEYLNKIIKLANSLKKQRREVNDLLRDSKLSDNPTYNTNLSILSNILKSQKDNILISIEKQAKSMKNENFNKTNMEIIKDRESQLDEVYNQYYQIKSYATNLNLMNEKFDAAKLGIDIAIYSSKDAEILAKKFGLQNKETQSINEREFSSALLKLNGEDKDLFRKYLKLVIEGTINPANEKYLPKNRESFEELIKDVPFVKKCVQIDNYNNVVYANTNQEGNKGINKGSSGFRNIDTSDDATFGEAYTEHGVRGLIKKSFDYFPNMTENQKDGRTNALFLGGMGFALFKLGKRFFAKPTETTDKNGKTIKGIGFLGKLGILGGVFLGSNMLTGKSPIELIDKALNGGMSREYLKGERGKEANEAKKTDKLEYVYPLVASTIFGKTKISDLGNALDDNFKIKDYEVLLQKAKEEGNQEVLDMLNRIGKTDPENQIKQGLEQFGIKKDNLTTFGEKTVDDLRIIYEANLGKALKYQTDKNLIKSENPEKIKEYNKLITSGKEITDADLKALVEKGVLYEQFEIKKNSSRETLKNKINKLEAGKSLNVIIDGENAKLSKINGTAEVELKSKGGKITRINLDLPSIIGLGVENGSDRKFVDKDNNPDVYSTILFAHKVNGFKNAYENRQVAAGDKPFEFENGKIYFNETKTGTTEINKVEVMDDGIKGLFSDFPNVFKGQERQIILYLNKEITTQNESLVDIVKKFNKRNIQIELSGADLKSHGEITKIDVTNKKIIGLDDSNGTGPNRQFENYSDLVGAANLINFFKKFLRNKQAQSKDPIYIGIDGNIAFNDKTIYEEIKSYTKRGANGFGDSDLVQSGSLTFRKSNSLKAISPTLYANRKEFVQYLNKKDNLFKEYIPEDKEAKKLAEIKKKISETLNDGIYPAIDFGEGSMEYNKEQKKLIIKGIDEKKIQNDKLVENLSKLNNLVSRYDLFDSEYVKKIELSNIDMKPGETISIKYLKKLLDFNPNKIQLGPDMLANKEMLKYVIEKKYSEGRFKIKENTNLDMNGIVILKYIYENGYDFDRLFNGERDSRLDFTMRVMQLLSEGQTIIDPDHKKELLKIKGAPITLKPNHDPIMEWRRVAKGENVNYADDIRRGIRNRFFTARNDNILEKIAKYYNENYPNIADR